MKETAGRDERYPPKTPMKRNTRGPEEVVSF